MQVLIAIIVSFLLIIILIFIKRRKVEIICDTHIWYELGNGRNDIVIPDNVKLIATFNSIDEFSRTENLVINPDYTRKGIQAMFEYSRSHAIYEPPLIYLKRLSDSTFPYDVLKEQGSILNFTSNVAKGAGIELSKSEEYRSFCKDRKADLESVSQIFNEQSVTIKKNIKSFSKHREEDSIPLNRKLISMFVEKATKSGGLPDNFDWKLVELFENVLKVYFNSLETGEYKSNPNDWYDLFLLIYVQPNRKLWTKEKKWLTLIDRCGMNAYLFNPKS